MFWTILKYFGIISGSLGSLYLVFTFFDGIRDDVKTIKTDVEMISVEQTWMAEGIAGIEDTLVEYKKEHEIQGQKINSISWGLRNHQNFTPEQFEEIMEELLKKNYSPIGLNNQTPLLENGYVNTTEPTEGKLNSSQ